jgi:thiol-disulfide isomerase/thioredoxin
VLYKLPRDIDRDIKTTLQSLGKNQYDFYKREGKKLDGFNFVDLNGISYTAENTKNKIVVIKCWFIACLPCIQEIPDLNQLKDQYKARKDILFISLAFDSNKALEAFLKRKQFDHAVIPNQEDYLLNDLKITGYPTHLIINKKGLISKVVSTVSDVKSVLHKEASKLD